MMNMHCQIRFISNFRLTIDSKLDQRIVLRRLYALVQRVDLHFLLVNLHQHFLSLQVRSLHHFDVLLILLLDQMIFGN